MSQLTLNDYQKQAMKTAIYKDSVVYPILGLCGEAGEVAEKVKKVLRDKNGAIDDACQSELKKELGDVLWYLAAVARDLDLTLGDVALSNLEKLASRAERGKLQGSGDNR